MYYIQCGNIGSILGDIMKPSEVLTKDILQLEFIDNKLSIADIAKKYNIKSKNSVTQFLKKYGLSRPTKLVGITLLTKEYLEEHYLVKNKSLKTIATEIGLKSKCSIKRALIRHGIDVRRFSKSDKIIDEAKRRMGPKFIHMNYWKSIEHRAKVTKKIDFEISIDYAYLIYLEQDGKCALTGLDICFRPVCGDKKEQTASLDRIDSSKGYIEGNVQWLHKKVNNMKWTLTNTEFIDFCKKVANKFSHDVDTTNNKVID